MMTLFKTMLRRTTAAILAGLVALAVLAGSQPALAVHVPLALDVPTLWTPVPGDGYLEFMNPVEYPALLPLGIPVPGTPPGVIMTEEYTGYTTAAGVDIIEVGDSDLVAGDTADFDWVQENRGCETGGLPCFNPLPVNHPGFVGAMGWTVGSPELSPQRTLTLEMTKTCSRKNGLVPPSVTTVTRVSHRTSPASA